MKKYKYVSLKIGKFFSAGTEEHRQIIDEHAREGYRYVGYIPTFIDCDGRVKTIDLIFEIDE